MADLLEQNRGDLEMERERTRATIGQARENARATIDAARINAQAKVDAARAAQASKPGFFGSLLSTVGGLVGTAVGGPIVGAVSSKLTSLIAPAPEPRVTETETEQTKAGGRTMTNVTKTLTEPPAPPGGGGALKPDRNEAGTRAVRRPMGASARRPPGGAAGGRTDMIDRGHTQERNREAGVLTGPARRSRWTRWAVGAVAVVLLGGVAYWFVPASIPPEGRAGVAEPGEEEPVSVANRIPAAEARRLLAAFDRGCAVARDGNRDPVAIRADMTSAQSLWDRFFNPISLADVEWGLSALAQLCDDTDRLLEIDSFVADVQRDLALLKERLDSIRPECGLPTVNWSGQGRRVGDLLEALTAAMDRMQSDGADEVAQLQADVLGGLGAMSTSLNYYELLVGDICDAYDLMRLDLEAERRLLADGASLSPAVETGQGGGRITLVTDRSAGYLQRFDRAFYVGSAVMRELQIMAIVRSAPESEAVMARTAELLDEIDSGRIEIGDLERARAVAEEIDSGPVGRAVRRSEAEYESRLAQLMVAEREVRLLQIRSKYDMQSLLDQNRGNLELRLASAKAGIGRARLNARATVEVVRVDAGARVTAARAAQEAKPGFFDSLLGTVGGLVGSPVEGALVGAVSSRLTSLN